MEKNELNVLITAGGTSERIDSVRRITNSGTGKLGALIAEAFASEKSDAYMASDVEAPYQLRIVYICTESAVRPCFGNKKIDLEIVVADDVSAVEAAILKAFRNTAFDVIIHSMAISDYRVKAVGDSVQMAKGTMNEPDTGAKISSDKDDLIIVLEKAPKLIAMLRGLAKDAVIVGFKLLSGVSEEELVSAGHALLQNNNCDFVLANDLNTVLSGRHEGLLIDSEGNFIRAAGKEAIADMIVKRVLSTLKK